jgi:hypothetical protein
VAGPTRGVRARSPAILCQQSVSTAPSLCHAQPRMAVTADPAELGRCSAEHGAGGQCVGAALASHGRGHRFETCHAHQHKRVPEPPSEALLPADCQQTTLSRRKNALSAVRFEGLDSLRWPPACTAESGGVRHLTRRQTAQGWRYATSTSWRVGMPFSLLRSTCLRIVPQRQSSSVPATAQTVHQRESPPPSLGLSTSESTRVGCRSPDPPHRHPAPGTGLGAIWPTVAWVGR